MILITIDAYSKWIDAQMVNTATASVTIEHLQTVLRKNDIWHVRVSPYHPSSNGMAEIAIKTLKEGVNECVTIH